MGLSRDGYSGLSINSPTTISRLHRDKHAQNAIGHALSLVDTPDKRRQIENRLASGSVPARVMSCFTLRKRG